MPGIKQPPIPLEITSPDVTFGLLPRFRRSGFQTGFTIIEMLVVIAIMTMLGSLIFTQIAGARARQRDTKREQDIKTLQNALAIYVINNKIYPVASGALTGTDAASVALINQETIQQIPKDPFNIGTYRYVYDSADGSTYTLTYYLETDTISGKSSGQQVAGP